MNERRSPDRHRFLPICLLGSLVALSPGGCLVYEVASVPVKVATTTVVVAGKTTEAVVETTGKVAIHAVKAAGTTTDAGLDAAARLSRDGMVTFTDVATGAVVRIPWKNGLQFAAATAQARLNTARRIVQILRAGKLIYASTREPASLALHSGDVVRLAI